MILLYEELSKKQKELLQHLVERWIIELKDNLMNLEINMPRELQPQAKEFINECITIGEETLEWLK